ncbi:NADPH-dependent ferric siderophore reductase [Mycolicibacterium sp. BK556]|uniref:siderophore-interacting protein n=1 Tax=unclassified Mycolicibacterium TaxID=2636767 RepID=UPI00161A3988|nr:MULTISPECIES: siderophore-interacting protein [unclassified Mycolicibacterium]MBB3600556.1 NADPH-dependent ferric siderophore reductase [Mycolicibacterium sp. BK556]MBB3630309.1 NADPH-dependent ferric siderophore reductase [Mycolicibacterium sp. BK607]MBB3748309.1 NADPH-dependent ferric siderophore reductase [Mycolicibacterium sp. BK634]
MSFSPATVLETLQLSPRLRRIGLRVEDPGSLAIPAGGDCAVGVYFDPTTPEEGRTYSVRRHDGDRIDLDIVLHTGGRGSTWAQTAAAGDRVGLDHARAWYHPPPGTARQLLVTDLSGLPAAARIIEEAPPAVAITVLVEAADHHDLDYLPVRPGVAIVPSLGTGNGFAPSRLADLARQVDLAAHGYCWSGCEAAVSREVRKYLRGHGWAIDQYDVTGYWRLDSEAWDARFALTSEEAVRVYRRAIADGKGDKLASEEFDDALERLGL